MKDRAVAGLLSGVGGGVALNVSSYISHYVFHIAKFGNVDLMSVAVMGQPARTALHVVAALLYDLIFAGALGTIFALSLGTIGKRHLWLKGWFFGLVVSLIALFLTTFFRMPHLLLIPPSTILAHAVDTSFWGTGMVYTLRLLLREAL